MATLSKNNESFFGLLHSNASNDLVVVGLPWDATSSYRRGAAAGPKAIRVATSGRLYNQFTERGMDLATYWKVCDHGDIEEVSDADGLKGALASAVNRHNHQNASMLFLGGDHFVTYPCFSLIEELQGRQLSLLYFDSHPDLYAIYEGALYSHATVVSRILDKYRAVSRAVCYVGIRASTKDQDERIATVALSAYTTHDVSVRGPSSIASSVKSALAGKPVYLSIDLDCLDPAFAPGVGNPQPGGLSTRQLLDILQGIEGMDIVAADLVEYAPNYDLSGITGFASAILVKQIMGIMAKGRPI